MYIRVRVTPGAKKETCLRTTDSEYIIAVKEKAERNMANKRVMELIALDLRKRVQEVKIVSGHHSRTKLLSI